MSITGREKQSRESRERSKYEEGTEPDEKTAENQNRNSLLLITV